MTTMTDETVVTARQLAVFAGNVNDRRVITEAREMAQRAGVNPDLVTEIRYVPARPPRTQRMIFTLYVLDEAGERVRLFRDASEFDEDLAAAGKPWVYALEDKEFKYRGEPPVWFAQAARVAVPTREEIPE